MTEPLNLNKTVALFWLITIIVLIIAYIRFSTDYVGGDNDDVLRLVQIRDFLSGQNWFDLQQYRLGLDGGTLMHWSRLIDAPIACLIVIFSAFTQVETAEAIALFIWPLLTTLPVIYGFAASSGAISGHKGVLVGSIGAVFYILGSGKFVPGAIDHHNVQLGIFAVLTSVLLYKNYPWISYALAGFLSALALAIGAETTPLIAAVCAIIAVTWAWYGGKTLRRPARIFSLSMGLSLTLIFFGTTPPHLYGHVVCDTLSMGFYTLGITGSAGLFFATAMLSYQSRVIRFVSLGAIGGAVIIVALIVAPQCLQSPLADLDPLIVEMWLNNVTEAQSIFALISVKPWSVMGYYFVPLLSVILCLVKVLKKKQTEQHLKLLVLIILATAISVLQVRAMIFSNLIAMIPMIALVTELRVRTHEEPRNPILASAFIVSVFVSMPIFWMILGSGLSKFSADEIKIASNKQQREIIQTGCKSRNAFAILANEPKGVVSGPSNLGASILRFTHHRAIAGPYHRNQSGLLAEIRSSLAAPSEAEQILRDAEVTHIAFCTLDPQVTLTARKAGDGLYANLAKGVIPDYLEVIDETANSAMQIYRLK